MRSAITTSLLLVSVGLVGCVAGDESTASDESYVVDSAEPQHFIVTRQDTRKCMYPMCGGWFVKRVNNAKTRCADGKMAKECHVVDLDLTALGISEEEGYTVDGEFGMGHAIVLGEITKVSGEFGVANTLVASQAWIGQAAVAPSGTFYAVELNGVRCITWPCPSFDEQKLDSTAKPKHLAGVDLAASGASQEAVDAGYEALIQGLLVAGKHHKITGPGGTMNELVASEFYIEVQAKQEPVGQMCGGFGGFMCPEGQICNIDIQNACNGADLSGTCMVPPDACIQLYEPVCGCNGETYSNNCHRVMAGVQLDHDGECEAGNE